MMVGHTASTILLPWRQDLRKDLGRFLDRLMEHRLEALLGGCLHNLVQDLPVRLVFEQDQQSLDNWTHVLVSDGAAYALNQILCFGSKKLIPHIVKINWIIVFNWGFRSLLWELLLHNL